MQLESRPGTTIQKPQLSKELAFAIPSIAERHMPRYRMHDTEDLSRELLGEMAALDSPFNQTNLDIVNTAINVAGRAHREKGQKRKFTGDDYLVHPLRVALLSIELARALNIPVTPELVVGAVLHDVPEDNENYTQGKIKNAFLEFETDMPEISQRIADSAEAFNHSNPTRTGRLSSREYHNKINDTKDPQLLLYRKINKIADRLDNLLDPPLPLHQVVLFPDKYEDKRLDFVNRTENSEAIIYLMLPEHDSPDTIDAFLMGVVREFVLRSQQTLQPDFDPDNLER